MTHPPLRSSSYVVLALVDQLEPATAYDLKRLAHSSVFNFWVLPHTVLYSETNRLADLGLLVGEQEVGGRRRRRFSLAPAGREALDRWRATAPDTFLELRDPGLLGLFGGVEERAVARAQLRLHRDKLAEYEELHRHHDAAAFTPGMRLALEAGIGIEREYVRFWSAVAHEGPEARPAST